MTIYPTLLGEQFEKLHPKLQQRYALPINQPFSAYGVMHTIKTGTNSKVTIRLKRDPPRL